MYVMRLDELIDNTLAIIKTRNYDENTWQFHFRDGKFSSIRQYLEELGADDFHVELVNEYIMALKKRYDNNELSYSRFAHLKKLALWLISVHETGELSRNSCRKSKIIVNKYFNDILLHHLSKMQEKLSQSNIPRQKSIILHLMDYL